MNLSVVGCGFQFRFESAMFGNAAILQHTQELVQIATISTSGRTNRISTFSQSSTTRNGKNG